MRPIDRIILEATRNLYCPVCGRSYTSGEIKIRGAFDNTYVLQTVCRNGHLPILTTFIAALPGSNARVKLVRPRPINQADYERFGRALESFDGNFQALGG